MLAVLLNLYVAVVCWSVCHVIDSASSLVDRRHRLQANASDCETGTTRWYVLEHVRTTTTVVVVQVSRHLLLMSTRLMHVCHYCHRTTTAVCPVPEYKAHGGVVVSEFSASPHQQSLVPLDDRPDLFVACSKPQHLHTKTLCSFIFSYARPAQL